MMDIDPELRKFEEILIPLLEELHDHKYNNNKNENIIESITTECKNLFGEEINKDKLI